MLDLKWRLRPSRRADGEPSGPAAPVREARRDAQMIKLGLPQAFARTFATTNPYGDDAGPLVVVDVAAFELGQDFVRHG